jgi:UDP-2,4-diacetamido-2,4,6-trideoxy-beta-L-altropyranose hydrolase
MIVFRVDTSAEIGSGHLMRCLALAQVLLQCGDRVTFASTHPLPRIGSDSSFGFWQVPPDLDADSDARWLATESARHHADWLVLDGYQFPPSYQETIRSAGHRLLCIDDHGSAGRYAANLILDQNLTANAERYRERARDSQLLLGTRFSLLREEFRGWREWRREFAVRARRLLVTFGGSDPVDATSRVIAALSACRDLEIVAIVGTKNTASFPELPHLRVLRDVEDMPRWISQCDLAISAGGSTCWELALLQTPMLLLPIAENQQPIAEALASRGAAINLGWHADLSEKTLQTTVERVLGDVDERRALGMAAGGLLDSEGAWRVAAQMKKPMLRLRRADAADSERIWQWSNDPAVRAASFRSEPIPWEDHCRWFDARLRDPGTSFYIADLHGPVGQVRFQAETPEVALISMSLGPAARGRGLGSALILAGCERFFAETTASQIRALIKLENVASLRAFSRAGFERSANVDLGGCEAAQFLLKRSPA